MTDVLGNQVPMLFGSLPSVISSVQAGKLRAIGVSSVARVALLPDVPAIGEQIPGFSGDLWVAFYAPRGTPQTVVNHLYTAIRTALANPALQQQFEKIGVVAMQDGPAQLAQRQAVEFQKWKQVVKASGATAD